ncbi:MAG: hypothetical protein M3Y69_05660 [Verrucomicrobiota bacterium]|nr:hypothetical protein [Verrucomicrobiota bacterium]
MNIARAAMLSPASVLKFSEDLGVAHPFFERLDATRQWFKEVAQNIASALHAKLTRVCVTHSGA